MIDAATSKLLHQPLTELKRAGEAGDETILAAIRTLFPIDAARERAQARDPAKAAPDPDPTKTKAKAGA
jgi:tetraacyldisaccharide-1-P 4'-kinase